MKTGLWERGCRKRCAGNGVRDRMQNIGVWETGCRKRCGKWGACEGAGNGCGKWGVKKRGAEQDAEDRRERNRGGERGAGYWGAGNSMGKRYGRQNKGWKRG